MDCELGGRRVVAANEGDLAVHQHRNEREISAEPIQLSNHQLRLVLLAGGQRLFQLGPVGALVALDLGKLVEQGPLAAIKIIDHGLALGAEAETGAALLIGRNAVIGDEPAVHAGMETTKHQCQDGKIFYRVLGSAPSCDDNASTAPGSPLPPCLSRVIASRIFSCEVGRTGGSC